MLNSKGSLRVRTYTAGGALPVKDAVVRIQGAEEENRLISYSLITDRDGITPRVDLPAPSQDLSLLPSPIESPYAIYDLEITADGYYPKIIRGLTVFSGIESVQLVNLIPASEPPIGDYPRGNQRVSIPQNTNLQ